MVNQQLLNELKQIIKEDFKTDLTPEILSEVGNSLVRFFELLIKIDNQSQNTLKKKPKLI
ncbi:hypothetical protein A2Z33_06280 [Candidatus Gottesmanbacteria bacterium RBG_16_52_11]|uniref:Uncharacterized protein n=1 Tax=Candidatus Gottesmanbacteria bacterium RBG_16_52_11 TaxID=1798374 RepID=A0A1F5YXH0_9BACT|nr:MAG: hypothetical protein A2Z33_06280 [Candidatus Gottesmanbacteria bacterium RBG_16_52_11]